jgi:hypothetical protein
LDALVSPLARLLRSRAASAAERQPAPPPGAGAPAGPPLPPADAAAALDVARLLGAVVSVRGAKAVSRFLTHEAADLEVALGLLLRLEAAEKAAADAAASSSSDDGDGEGNDANRRADSPGGWSPAEGLAARSWPWQEAQAVVLLWLSLLALAPFDLAVLDSSLDGGGSGAGSSNSGSLRPPPPLARRLASACAARLHETGPAREMAALVLARLLTRPDMSALLGEFFEWQRSALEAAAVAAAAVADGNGGGGARAAAAEEEATPTASSAPLPPTLAWPVPFPPTIAVAASAAAATEKGDATAAATAAHHHHQQAAQAAARATFFAPGALRALGLIFKLGPRSACAPLAARAWAQLERLQEAEQGDAGASSAAATPPRLLLASPLSRRLVAKLAQRVALALLPPSAAPSSSSAAPSAPPPPPPTTTPTTVELHEAVEGCLGWLLDAALPDRDTVVRWSAAKGVARIAAALPCRDLADEVAASIIGGGMLFAEGGSDAAWHGGCLVLAELARRGCLPAERLAEAAPVVAQALSYDAPARGGGAAHSVGAHVRDAAAYVCWALARAFGGALEASARLAAEQAFREHLAPALLAAACYDREVHCRRAAAAAFQEAVGRLGGGSCLAHGLAALHAADYSSVGQASRAALRVGPAIARLGEEGKYRPALVRLLVERQLRHWDARGTRALAARALAALVPALLLPPSAEKKVEDGIALLTDGQRGAIRTLLARVGPDATLEERTGALLAVGKVLPALARASAAAEAQAAAATAAAAPPRPAALSQLHLCSEDAHAAAGLLPRVAACGLYRGRGGEAVREAAARLLEGQSRAQEEGAGGDRDRHLWSLPLGPAHHDAARLLLDDCSRHPSERVRLAGARALRAYARSLVGAAARTRRRGAARALFVGVAAAADDAAAAALPALEALIDRTWPDRLLSDALPVHRRGAAGALGALPAGILLLPPPDAAGGGGAVAADDASSSSGLAERRRARPEALLRALALASLEGAELEDPDCDDEEGEQKQQQRGGVGASPPLPPLAAECRDAEARAAAAEALGRLCGELWPVQGGPNEAIGPTEDRGGGDDDEEEEEKEEEEKEGQGVGDDDEHHHHHGNPAAAAANERDFAADPALLSAVALPALLAACRDCTTDSRGDAGAWVREAAVGALGRALPPALLATAAAADAAATASAGGRLCRAAIGALLQQALGRIARLRHAALRELRAVLPPPAPLDTAAGGSGAGTTTAAAAATAGRCVLPGADALSRAVHAARGLDEAGGVASLAAFEAVAALLLSPPQQEHATATSDDPTAAYRYPWLLEGVVAAAGGVDAALARAAGRALASAARGGASAAAVAAGVVRLWRRAQRQRAAGLAATGSSTDARAVSAAAAHARLATPLVRAALLLLRKGGAGVAWLPLPLSTTHKEGDEAGGGCCFAAAIVALLRAEVRGCADIPRLVEAAALAAELTDQASSSAAAASTAAAATAEPTRGAGASSLAPPPLEQLLALRADSARLLLVLLGNRYPRVRRAAAEAAYVALLGARADAARAAVVAVSKPDSPPQQLHAHLPTLAQLDEAAALLLRGAAWDAADLASARASRDALAALLRVEPPRAVAVAAAGVVAAADAAGPGVAGAPPPDAVKSDAGVTAEVTLRSRWGAVAGAAGAAGAAAAVPASKASGRGRYDENASYQSLLDDAARGGGY